MAELKHTEKFLRTYGNQVENEIESRLKGHGKYASGKLYDSIRYEIRLSGKGMTLSFMMADYGVYVDKGVNGYLLRRGSPYSFKKKDGKGSGGKSKFIGQLQKWCTIKGLPKGAAFPIRQKIWKEGIAPTQFFTIPTTRRKKQFTDGLEKAWVADINDELKRILVEESRKQKGLKIKIR